MIIEYLDGFECKEFKIKNGYYFDNISGKSTLIEIISELGNVGIVIYDRSHNSIRVLFKNVPPDRENIKNMLSFILYNKRKRILKDLNIE